MTKALAKPKPKRQPDQRHALVHAILAKYWAVENPALPDLPWGPDSAGALGSLLKANPSLTVEQITQMLRNRLKSDDHAAGEPVFAWIRYITRYHAGPLNKYKQLKETTDGTKAPNRADQQHEHARNATGAALARVRGVARD